MYSYAVCCCVNFFQSIFYIIIHFLRLWFEGMLSHQLKQHVIDGEKTIIQNPTDQQRYRLGFFYPGNVHKDYIKGKGP